MDIKSLDIDTLNNIYGDNKNTNFLKSYISFLALNRIIIYFNIFSLIILFFILFETGEFIASLIIILGLLLTINGIIYGKSILRENIQNEKEKNNKVLKYIDDNYNIKSTNDNYGKSDKNIIMYNILSQNINKNEYNENSFDFKKLENNDFIDNFNSNFLGNYKPYLFFNDDSFIANALYLYTLSGIRSSSVDNKCLITRIKFKTSLKFKFILKENSLFFLDGENKLSESGTKIVNIFNDFCSLQENKGKIYNFFLDGEYLYIKYDLLDSGKDIFSVNEYIKEFHNHLLLAEKIVKFSNFNL